MSHPNPRRAGDDRARRHIKALLEETKRQAADGPLHVQAFLSGMLSGLAASAEILDGGTAEGTLEKMGERLAAAIGQAYLDGKLPERPSDLVPDPEQEEASSPNTLHAELQQAQAAIKRVRRLSEMTIKTSMRVHARHQALDTLAALDDTTNPADAMQDAGSPVMTGFTNGIGGKAADHVGQASAQREEIAEALWLLDHPDWSMRMVDSDVADQYRARADRVLTVIQPHAGIYVGLAHSADADVQRVIALYEQWVKAGPPPLGTSLARWWDARLVELREAVLGSGPKDPS